MKLLLISIVAIVILALLLNRNIKNARLKFDRKARFNSLPIHYTYCFVLWAVIFSAAIIFSSFSALTKQLLLAVFLAGIFFLIKLFNNKAKNIFFLSKILIRKNISKKPEPLRCLSPQQLAF